MANHLDLEEQEQLDQIKHFWNKWGTLLSIVLIVSLGAIAAWNAYQYWQGRQASHAAALVDAVEGAGKTGDQTRMQQAFSDLRTKYAGTTQADQAGLAVAKMLLDAGNVPGAKEALTWVADQSSDDGYKSIAKIRLASILIDEKILDQAFKKLSENFPVEFKSIVADRKGDVLMLLNKPQEAYLEYQRAISGFDNDIDYRRIVEVKMNSLGIDAKKIDFQSNPIESKK
ncbi:MAG: tetratricopeptide repeat protein [Burkholderiaceae bacterium]|nr:tetratricopeptide repeat protein [Burkholderiaceae bacterium]